MSESEIIFVGKIPLNHDNWSLAQKILPKHLTDPWLKNPPEAYLLTSGSIIRRQFYLHIFRPKFKKLDYVYERKPFQKAIVDYKLYIYSNYIQFWKVNRTKQKPAAGAARFWILYRSLPVKMTKICGRGGDL